MELLILNETTKADTTARLDGYIKQYLQEKQQTQMDVSKQVVWYFHPT